MRARGRAVEVSACGYVVATAGGRCIGRRREEEEVVEVVVVVRLRGGGERRKRTRLDWTGVSSAVGGREESRVVVWVVNLCVTGEDQRGGVVDSFICSDNTSRAGRRRGHAPKNMVLTFTELPALCRPFSKLLSKVWFLLLIGGIAMHVRIYVT